VLGAHHPDILTTRANLAYLLGKAGQMHEAAREFRWLLADRIRVLGRDDPITLSTRGNLAYCLARTGQTREAISQLRRLLKDRTRILGPNHPDTVATFNNLEFLQEHSPVWAEDAAVACGLSSNDWS